MDHKNNSLKDFSLRTLIVIGILLLTVAMTVITWYSLDVILLIFAGILLAITLRGISQYLSEYLPLSQKLWLTVTILLGFSSLIFGFWYFGPHVARQINVLSDSTLNSLNHLLDEIRKFDIGEKIISEATKSFEETQKLNILARITGIFSSTLSLLINLLIVLFVGLYTAYEPKQYVDGFIRLVPISYRDRMKEIIISVEHALRWYIIGRILSMISIGIFTLIGLWLLDVPLAFSLATLAALMTFIPYLGPILSATPAILIALSISPAMALYVALLYTGIQLIESYLITPLIQLRAVSLPPVLTIATQIILGIVAGGIGLVMATPFTVMIIVLIQTVYIEDILGDTIPLLGQHSENDS
jgi:predicted PurR-regulated permease PerM